MAPLRLACLSRHTAQLHAGASALPHFSCFLTSADVQLRHLAGDGGQRQAQRAATVCSAARLLQSARSLVRPVRAAANPKKPLSVPATSAPPTHAAAVSGSATMPTYQEEAPVTMPASQDPDRPGPAHCAAGSLRSCGSSSARRWYPGEPPCASRRPLPDRHTPRTSPHHLTAASAAIAGTTTLCLWCTLHIRMYKQQHAARHTQNTGKRTTDRQPVSGRQPRLNLASPTLPPPHTLQVLATLGTACPRCARR